MVMARQVKSKYHSKKVHSSNGDFDSRREYRRYLTLKSREAAGDIESLERQVKYVLIPTQREPDTIGKRGGIKKGKVIERECTYIADFRYFDNKRGCVVVEDCKGFRTKEYKIKKKLMLYMHGIRVEES